MTERAGSFEVMVITVDGSSHNLRDVTAREVQVLADALDRGGALQLSTSHVVRRVDRWIPAHRVAEIIATFTPTYAEEPRFAPELGA
jgi:hypothetical protein